ncbi:unnamed protein product, partial [Iphiclides podalirius]
MRRGQMHKMRFGPSLFLSLAPARTDRLDLRRRAAVDPRRSSANTARRVAVYVRLYPPGRPLLTIHCRHYSDTRFGGREEMAANETEPCLRRQNAAKCLTRGALRPLGDASLSFDTGTPRPTECGNVATLIAGMVSPVAGGCAPHSKAMSGPHYDPRVFLRAPSWTLHDPKT